MNKSPLLFIILCCLSFIVSANTLPVVNKLVKFQGNLQQPSAVAISETGQVYVLDGTNHRVVVFSETGQRLFQFGAKGKNGLDKPMDISLFGQQIVVADTGLERLVIYNLKGTFIKEIELDNGGNEKINPPVPISVFMDETHIYWGDRPNHRICKTDLKTGKLVQCFGKRGETEGLFQYPWQIASDRDGYLHIVDVLNGRVQIFHKTGKFFSQTSRFGLNEGELYRPNGIAIDDTDTVFISDSYFGTVSLFKNNKFITPLRMADGSLLKFKVPVGVALHKNYLYVADAEENSVYQISLSYVDEKSLNLKPSQNKSPSISQKNCVTCHLSWAKEKQLTSQDYKDEVLPVASFEMCYSCHHGVILDSRLMIKHEGQHPSIYDPKKDKLTLKEMNKREDAMPEEFPITHNKEMLCTSCHTPHNSEVGVQTLYVEHQNSWMRVSSKDGNLCERCHESKIKNAREFDKKKRGINHPLAIKLEAPAKKNEAGYATEKELQKGLPDDLKKALASLSTQNQIICQSCHQVHGGKGNDLLAITKDKGALCVQCHAKQDSKDEKEARRKGIHPVNVKLEKPITRRGEKIAKVTCDSCHKVHNGRLGTDLLPNYMKKSEDLCLDCHERQHAKDEKEALKKGVHPTNENLDKPVTIAGKKIHKLGCLSCHSIHDGEPNTPSLLEKYKQDELCKNCHKKYFAKDKKEAVKKGIHPTHQKLKKAVKIGDHKFKQLTCSSCHSVHKGEKNTPALVQKYKQDELCKNCHKKYFAKDKKEAVKKGIHPTHQKLEEEVKIGDHKFKQLTCSSCHSVHEGKKNTPALVQEYKKDELCKNCHEKYFAKNKKEALKKGIHPMNHKLDKAVKIAKKEVQQMSCLSCHVIHKDGQSDTPALLEKYKNGEICKHCHENKRPIVGTDHDLRITAKDKKNKLDELPKVSGVCGTCHTMHRGDGKQPHLFVAKIITNTVQEKDNNKSDSALFEEDKLCLNCHQQGGMAEKRAVKYFSHPYRDMILRSDKNIMPLLGKNGTIKEFGSIACITCHEPHLWQPLAVNKNPQPLLTKKNLEGTSKDSFLRRLGVVDTFCVSCHSLEALPKYKYYHHKDKVRNIGVDYLK